MKRKPSEASIGQAVWLLKGALGGERDSRGKVVGHAMVHDPNDGMFRPMLIVELSEEDCGYMVKESGDRGSYITKVVVSPDSLEIIED